MAKKKNAQIWKQSAAKASKKANTPSVRLAAVEVLVALQKHEGSLATLVPAAQEKLPESDRALLQELCFGVSRWFHALLPHLDSYMDKPLRNKDVDVKTLLLLGLYQLDHLRIPAHAAINLTVEAAVELRKPWARGLVNAVLRSHLRESEKLAEDEANEPDVLSKSGRAGDSRAYSHPDWMIETIGKDWPQSWQAILREANQRPPMVLRVNLARIKLDDYLALLVEAGIEHHKVDGVESAIQLAQSSGVHLLPGFADGLVSVQDASAQLAVHLLQPELAAANEQLLILDACAAPGGKTCHLLEASKARVCAVDISESRLQRVQENLERLGLEERAQIACVDAADGELHHLNEAKALFDLILLDAPCSGSGVIRRQPDIKLLRKPDDLHDLAVLQRKLLRSLWPSLKVGGKLLYVTCSIFRQENVDVIVDFLGARADAKAIPLHERSGGLLDAMPAAIPVGAQILSGANGMDGFYYCLLEKSDLTHDEH